MDRNEAMKHALEIVKAQASVRTMSDAEITGMVRNLTGSIMGLDETRQPEVVSTPMGGDPKKAITENHVTCLCCGKKFKVLTKKHLATHGLTLDEYRAKYGYKKGAALACKALVRERRKKMKEMQLWTRRQKPATESQQ